MVESGENIGGHRNDDEHIRHSARYKAENTGYSSAI